MVTCYVCCKVFELVVGSTFALVIGNGIHEENAIQLIEFSKRCVKSNVGPLQSTRFDSMILGNGQTSKGM